MTRTPRTRATLKALEEVTTAVRKRGAPTNFVFAEASDSAESDSSSDSDDESLSSEEDNRDTRTKKTAGKAKGKVPVQTKKAPAKGKKNSSQQHDDEQLDLFEALRQGRKDNGVAVAAKWIPRSSSEPGVCEMLTLMLMMAGASPESCSVPEFKKSTDATLSIACNSIEIGSNAFITGKAPEAKRTIASFSTFMYEIGRGRNRDACIAAFECSLAASRAPIKTIRQVGTVAAMNLGLGLLNRADQLRKELERAVSLFGIETTACENKIKGEKSKQTLHAATKKFLDALAEIPKAVCRKPPPNESEISADSTFDEAVEEVQRAMDEWRDAGKAGLLSDRARQSAAECSKIAKELRLTERRAFEGRDSVFYEVAKARFRDVDPSVRGTVADMLGSWSALYPEAMCVAHRSKYLGWMLYDKSSNVRSEALAGLARLVESEGSVGDRENVERNLAVFAGRFVERFKGMLSDVDPQVVVSALRLCAVLVKEELLNREEHGDLFDAAEELVFYAPERDDVEMTQSDRAPWMTVRVEAARFVSQYEERFMATSAPSTDKQTGRGKRAKAQTEAENVLEVKLRAFLDLALRRLGTNADSPMWAHLESVFGLDAFVALAEDESSEGADSLNPFDDPESILNLLSDDALVQKDARIGPILAALLLRIMERRTRSGENTIEKKEDAEPAKRKRTKHSTQQQQGGSDDTVARRLPELLVRFRSDEFVLERLVRVIPLVSLFTSQVDKLVRELAAVLEEKTLEELLEGTALALGALSEERRPEAKHALAALTRVGERVNRAMEETVLSANEADADSTAWLARIGAVVCGTALGESLLEEATVHKLLAAAKRASRPTKWLVGALKVGFGCASWHVATRCGSDPTTSAESLVRAKRDRNALAEVFRRALDLCLETSSDGDENSKDVKARAALGLEVLGLFHDTRSVYWPGHAHLGWVPPADLVERADAVFMDVVVPVLHEDPVAMRFAYEKVLIPMARTALFASPRKDAKSAALVLRFVHAPEPGLKRIALRLNTEMRKTDVDRWLQAHLETLSIDPEHSESLSKTLGPSSDKVAQAIGSAVSGMVCRALRLAHEQRSEALLNAVTPYLVFCKQGSRARERITTLWESISESVRQEDPDFGSAFESKLYKSTKRGRASDASEGGEDEDVAMTSGVKKPRASSGAGKKREPRDDSDEDDSPPPRKSARQLNLVAASASGTSKIPTDQLRTDDSDGDEDLEKSVFEESSKGKNVQRPEKEIDEFEDDRKSDAMDIETQTKKKSAARSSLRKQEPSTKISLGSSSKRVTHKEISDDEVEEDDDDDDLQVGFRPRLRWQTQ